MLHQTKPFLQLDDLVGNIKTIAYLYLIYFIILKNLDNYRFPCLAVVGIYEEIDIQLLEVVSKVQVDFHFSLLVASGSNIEHTVVIHSVTISFNGMICSSA